MSERYLIRKSETPVNLAAGWDSPQWRAAGEVSVDYKFDCSSDFTPGVKVKMLYDDNRICGLFQVVDQYVVARAFQDQDMVCLDSCVEFFVHPNTDERYFNFEMNCGGKVLLYHALECRAGKYDVIPPEDMAVIERFHTLPDRIPEEIAEPTSWYLGFAVPISFFVKYSAVKLPLSGQIWRGNFTKCADKSSHPCWLSWQKLSKCNFHLFREFGELEFE